MEVMDNLWDGKVNKFFSENSCFHKWGITWSGGKHLGHLELFWTSKKYVERVGI